VTGPLHVRTRTITGTALTALAALRATGQEGSASDATAA
jgi:hypothetical protein